VSTDGEETALSSQMFVWAAAMGVVSTLWGYELGTGNQMEYVVALRRLLDSDYLSADFLANATAGFGPRSYFYWIATVVSIPLGIPGGLFFLALFANIAMACLSASIARRLFASSTAGVLAAALCLRLDTLTLGGAVRVASPRILQSTLAMPFVVAAFACAVSNRPVWFGVLAGIATLIHPLVGMELGAVLSLSLAAVAWIKHRDVETTPFKSLVPGLLIFASMSLFTLVPYARLPRGDSASFIEALTFRAPHHYVPSSFPLGDYVGALLFIAGTLVCWRGLGQRSVVPDRVVTFIVSAISVILLLCVGGFVFVELFPSRLWVTAQTFRSLALVKWVGGLGIAGLGATLLDGVERREKVRGASAVLMGALSPLTMFVTQLVEAPPHSALRKPFSARPTLAMIGVTSAVIAYVLVTAQENLPLLLLVAIGLSATATPLAGRIAAMAAVAATGFALAVMPQSDGGRFHLRPAALTLEESTDDGKGIAAAVRTLTPADAVLVTPPRFGTLRLRADRALVIDFMGVPFTDHELEAWRERIRTVYGEVDSQGFHAAADLERRYRTIGDDALAEIARELGATHAVLYSETETKFPVLHREERFQLVEISRDGT